MAQKKEYFAFISDKRKILRAQNCRSYSDVVRHRFSYGIPLVLFWLLYGILMRISSAFEEGSKVMQLENGQR